MRITDSIFPQVRRPSLLFRSIAACFLALWLIGAVSTTAAAETFTLEQTIERALEANLSLKRARAEIEASTYTRKSQGTEFLPTFSTSYRYTYHDQERRSLGALTRPQDEYSFSATVSQPLFTGFALLNQYRITELGESLASTGKKASAAASFSRPATPTFRS